MENILADHNSESDPTAVIGEMADLLAKHKLVPFFGAGLSRQHLGVAAAELAGELAAAVGRPADVPLSDIADVFVDEQGETEFVAFLHRRLVVTELDERKAPSHRLLVSLMQNLLYTTNQDNLFELTSSRYGRNYRRVVTIDDLTESVPGEPLLIKFHGDTSVPESLVFGARSYRKRMEKQDHPLDIKLRADLLGKRLLFLGYSLRDENIAKIFESVRRAFNGTLPTSYLVAFDDDASLMATAAEYQVKVIVPSRLFPELAGDAEAFEHFLQMLCDETRKRQVEAGMADLFSDGAINPRIATDYETKAVAHAIENDSFDTALDAYRVTFDQSHVPEYLQQEVTGLFVALVARVDPTNHKEMDALSAALFNFRLPPAWALTATAAVMSACNRRAAERGYDSYCSLVCPSLSDGMMPVAAAAAVEMLAERGEAVTDNFRKLASSWFQGYESVHESAKEQVIAMIKTAWAGDKEVQSPLHRSFSSLGQGKSFHQILAGLQGRLPKRLDNPKE